MSIWFEHSLTEPACWIVQWWGVRKIFVAGCPSREQSRKPVQSQWNVSFKRKKSNITVLPKTNVIDYCQRNVTWRFSSLSHDSKTVFKTVVLIVSAANSPNDTDDCKLTCEIFFSFALFSVFLFRNCRVTSLVLTVIAALSYHFFNKNK